MTDSAPFSVAYDLSKLSNAGVELDIVASDGQGKQLAEWAGVDEVRSFAAKVTLHRPSQNRFTYQAALTSEITQSCVVTLEPVHARLSLEISRSLHLSKMSSHAGISQGDLLNGDDEGSEEIDSPLYDLAGPLLEEFALAIDPYPRAPGVVFAPPGMDETGDNPFDILKSLKKGG